jgi:hypothetical protein
VKPVAAAVESVTAPVELIPCAPIAIALSLLKLNDVDEVELSEVNGPELLRLTLAPALAARVPATTVENGVDELAPMKS